MKKSPMQKIGGTTLCTEKSRVFVHGLEYYASSLELVIGYVESSSDGQNYKYESCAARAHRYGCDLSIIPQVRALMDFREMQAVMRDLEELGFVLGLSMWMDGAQHFTGNLRLLLDVYLYQKNVESVEEILERHGLWFWVRGMSEAFFVVVGS